MALVNLNEYKAYYGITSTTQDTEISANLVRAQALADSFCGYALESTTYVDELYDGGVNTLLLKAMPVTAVTAVKENSIPTTDYTLYPEDGIIVKGNQSVRTLTTTGIFAAGLRNIAVSYVAGYTVASEDLKLALLKIAKFLLSDKKAGHSNKQVLHGEERSGRSSPNILELGFLPLDIKDLLIPYRMM